MLLTESLGTEMLAAVVELTVILGLSGSGTEEKVHIYHSLTSKALVEITHSVEYYFGTSHGHWGGVLMCPQWI